MRRWVNGYWLQPHLRLREDDVESQPALLWCCCRTEGSHPVGCPMKYTHNFNKHRNECDNADVELLTLYKLYFNRIVARSWIPFSLLSFASETHKETYLAATLCAPVLSQLAADKAWVTSGSPHCQDHRSRWCIYTTTSGIKLLSGCSELDAVSSGKRANAATVGDGYASLSTLINEIYMSEE